MEITLVYLHQLFANHPAIANGRAIWLIEDSLFFGNDARWPTAMHQQKLMLHRASMKAYFSGSNYQLKMSDEPKGPWCQIWDGLFWSFIADHEAFFLRNPRLSMMVRTWHKQPPERQADHLQVAVGFLAILDECV